MAGRDEPGAADSFQVLQELRRLFIFCPKTSSQVQIISRLTVKSNMISWVVHNSPLHVSF